MATKDELSLSVLGRRREPYDRSIDVHVSNLRKKLLTASNKAIEIETVRAVGYRLKVTAMRRPLFLKLFLSVCISFHSGVLFRLAGGCGVE